MKVFKNQLVYVYEIDHKMDHVAVQGVFRESNYIICALNGVGIFKWLYTHYKNSVNPELDTKNATLVKIMPVPRGFQINRLVRNGDQYLVGLADSEVMKFETTQGYIGYYSSSTIS